MPEYVLRNVDPHLWSRFTERANCDGWPIKALVVSLMDDYANGVVTPTQPPPQELPEFAWLRGHHRIVAEQEGFAQLNPIEQWARLLDHVLKSPAGGSWPVLDAVPAAKLAQILDWFTRTSNIETRHTLTLRAIAHIGEGPDLRRNRRAFHFEVLGLPPGQQAWIADFDGGWRILRVVNGEQGHWSDPPHLTKELALEALAKTVHGESK